jgi:hypothetical protein
MLFYVGQELSIFQRAFEYAISIHPPTDPGPGMSGSADFISLSTEEKVGK